MQRMALGPQKAHNTNQKLGWLVVMSISLFLSREIRVLDLLDLFISQAYEAMSN